MPTVLEAPEIVQEATWQRYHDDPPLITPQPPRRQGCAGIRTWLRFAQIAWTRDHVDHDRQVRRGSPQLERGLDILAREHPFLYVLSTAG